MNNKSRYLVLIGVSLVSFLGCIDFTIVNTALPAIQTGLNMSMTELQWVINIFLLGLCACMVIMGRMADLYGRRLILYIGMLGFGLTSLGVGLSSNIPLLLSFRLGQGIFTAILYTATGAIVSNAFDKKDRGKAMGILFGVNGIGLAIGPVLGGIIVGALSWRWVFLVNVPLIILSFIICIPNVRESKSQEKGMRIDWWGLLFLSIGLSSLVFALVNGYSWGFTSSKILALFIVAIISLIVFYLVEQKTRSPIIKFDLLLNRLFISSIIGTAALGFFYCLAFFLMPLYLHYIEGFSSMQLGLLLLPTSAVMAILSPIVGRATDHFGPKPLLILGLGFFIVSAGMQSTFMGNTNLVYICIAFAAMGVGWSMLLGPATVAALSAVPENMGAVAMGASWTLHNVGGVLGLAFGTVLYHYVSINTLMNKLAIHIHGKSWIDRVIADPANAALLIRDNTNLSLHQALSVFQISFLKGYHGAMFLLVASSVIALITILFVMPKRLIN
jgi:EmrB/QacA subfamily drug resistance transporter